MTRPKQNPGLAGRGVSGATHKDFHVQNATAEPLLQRLELVQKSGNGWRAVCPACAGKSRKLVITEVEGRALLHCFGGCKAGEVLDAAGLSWSDIMPPRHWPKSPAERMQARRAFREAGWASALGVLALETAVVAAASTELIAGLALNLDDHARLQVACDRIARARAVLNAR